MTRSGVARWGVATVAFLAIGLVSMRTRHAVGLALLVIVLLVVFAMDLAAKRLEGRDASADAPPQSGPRPEHDLGTPRASDEAPGAEPGA